MSIDSTGVERPMLPIEIINPDTSLSVRTWGLIDTGADGCSMPAAMAGILGHQLLKGKVKQINTGNGVTNAYAHTTTINIFHYDGSEFTDRVVHTIEAAPIDFMPNLHCVILGVRNFLGEFILTVDYQRKRFSVRKDT